MKIDRAALDKMAHLARLEFDDKDADKMMADMSNIVSWVEKLHEVDTEGVEPLTTMSHEINALRNDIAKNDLTQEQAFSHAPATHHHFFKVPKVIE
jgi:aspartyl-tRNA(Asn)/glutamyl-tRNA(Gln) amidotransferase subunit C